MKLTVFVFALCAALTGCSSDDDGGGGSDATSGSDGTDGTDGGNGTDGVDSTDGTDGCAKAAPAGAPCNPYCQTGCDAGQHCTFQNNAVACAESGTAQDGEACQGSTDCAPGAACFRIDGGESACHTFCIDDDGCDGGRKCDLVVQFSGGGPEATFCGDVVQGCDVFAADDGCPDGQACYAVTGGPRCLAEGSLAAGDLCRESGGSSCAPGLQCVIACTEVCSTGDGNPKCGDTCQNGFDEMSGQDGIGFCIPDQPPMECDLFAQTGCDAGQACYPAVGGWACFNEGTKAAGDACQSTGECAPGTICANALCLEVCLVNGDAALSCDVRCPESSAPIDPEVWNVAVCLPAE